MRARRAGNQWKEMGQTMRSWGVKNQRRMPWRKKADEYGLAVAEILLQKTKAGDVEPVWSAVVTAYPDAAALAKADDLALLILIKHLGLGKQRVERLKSMAVGLLASPSTAIPGLGPYGSGILALAKGGEVSAIPVDGNIARVVCRLKGLSFERGEPRKKQEVRRVVAELLETQASAKNKLQLIYALVDLGASVCKVGRPSCSDCPLSPWCDFAATSSWTE